MLRAHSNYKKGQSAGEATQSRCWIRDRYHIRKRLHLLLGGRGTSRCVGELYESGLIFRCVGKIAKPPLASSCMYVRPSAWNNSVPTGRILMKFWYLSIFRKSVEKIQVSLKNLTRITGTGSSREGVRSCMISHRITLRMKNASGLSCRERQHTRFMFP